MIQCRRCNQYKEESEFTPSDRTHNRYCKSCRNEINRINHIKRTSKPLSEWAEHSTRLGITLLKQQGIPCCFGVNVNKAWQDIMAWACVPIEVKYSITPQKYKWQFTPYQRIKRHEGLFMFIGNHNLSYDVFIVPCNTEWLSDNGVVKVTAVSVVPNCDHFNAKNWELLKPYQDRYDLIEEYRLLYSSNLKNEPS